MRRAITKTRKNIARLECDLGMCDHVRNGHMCHCTCRACPPPLPPRMMVDPEIMG